MAAMGSVVHVPYRRHVFEIVGAVNVPGTYGLLAGDRVSDALRAAGGARGEAQLSSVELVRFLSEDPQEYGSVTLDLSARGWESGETNLTLEDGDRVYVRRDDLWHTTYRVEVQGEVERAGPYSIVEGEDSLADVIGRAGGFTAWADLARASLVRRSPLGEDTPTGREVAFLTESDRGSLSTEEASYLRSTTVEPSVLVSVDFREVFSEEGARTDVLLRGGDVIEIPRRMDVVRVSGAVSDPGYVDFVEGASPRDYVVAAGGYIDRANGRRMSIVRSVTGQSVRATGTGAAVRPGDTVFVPLRAETDWLQVTKDILSIAGQLATIYIVIDNVTTN